MGGHKHEGFSKCGEECKDNCGCEDTRPLPVVETRIRSAIGALNGAVPILCMINNPRSGSDVHSLCQQIYTGKPAYVKFSSHWRLPVGSGLPWVHQELEFRLYKLRDQLLRAHGLTGPHHWVMIKGNTAVQGVFPDPFALFFCFDNEVDAGATYLTAIDAAERAFLEQVPENSNEGLQWHIHEIFSSARTVAEHPISHLIVPRSSANPMLPAEN